MKSSLAQTDALIFSPTEIAASPERLPDIFDAFARLAEGVERRESARSRKDGEIFWAPQFAPDCWFRVTPLLRDGTAYPWHVPARWNGRVTREAIAAYTRARWAFLARPRGWGAHWRSLELDPDRTKHIAYYVLDAKRPFVDAVRDTAKPDDEHTLPVEPQIQGDWRPILSSWEHVDGFMASPEPGPAWLRARSAQVRATNGRFWWQLRGYRDAGDIARYGRELWDQPHAVALYLGWPAYLVAQAGQIRRCHACGGAAIGGRRYCGSRECDRARAAARKRLSRPSG